MPIGNVPEPKINRGRFIPRIRLREDQESSTLLFTTKWEGVAWERFHKKMEGQDFRGYTICPKQAFGQDCFICSTDSNNFPGLRIMMWVIEKHHDYTKPGDNRVELKVGNRTVYREEVNEPKILEISTAQKDTIKSRDERHDDLLDYEFEWIRNGAANYQGTTYILERGDKINDEEKAAVATTLSEIPLLEKVLLGQNTFEAEETPTREYAVRAIDNDEPLPFDTTGPETDDDEEAPW